MPHLTHSLVSKPGRHESQANMDPLGRMSCQELRGTQDCKSLVTLQVCPLTLPFLFDGTSGSFDITRASTKQFECKTHPPRFLLNLGPRVLAVSVCNCTVKSSKGRNLSLSLHQKGSSTKIAQITRLYRPLASSSGQAPRSMSPLGPFRETHCRRCNMQMSVQKNTPI